MTIPIRIDNSLVGLDNNAQIEALLIDHLDSFSQGIDSIRVKCHVSSLALTQLKTPQCELFVAIPGQRVVYSQATDPQLMKAVERAAGSIQRLLEQKR